MRKYKMDGGNQDDPIINAAGQATKNSQNWFNRGQSFENPYLSGGKFGASGIEQWIRQMMGGAPAQPGMGGMTPAGSGQHGINPQSPMANIGGHTQPMGNIGGSTPGSSGMATMGTQGSPGGGFQLDPWAKQAIKQQTTAANNAAAAGGLIGTPVNQKQNMQIANNITNQDEAQRQQMILNALNMLYGGGANAAGRMAGGAFQTGNEINQNIFDAGKAQAQNNANSDNFWNNMIGSGASIIGRFL